MGDSLVRRLIKPGIILLLVAAVSLGFYRIYKSSKCNSRINEIFNEKIELKYGYSPYCRRIAMACNEAGILYDPQNPRELTQKEKKIYLKFNGIEVDDWGKRK